jgi:hypothetical protein
MKRVQMSGVASRCPWVAPSCSRTEDVATFVRGGLLLRLHKNEKHNNNNQR